MKQCALSTPAPSPFLKELANLRRARNSDDLPQGEARIRYRRNLAFNYKRQSRTGGRSRECFCVAVETVTGKKLPHRIVWEFRSERQSVFHRDYERSVSCPD